MRGIIVHINGWPGVGKYSIGRIAADELGARLVPNHAINAAGFALAEFDTPVFRKVVRQVRSLVYEEIVSAAAEARFILTSVLIEDEADAALFESIQSLATRRNCAFMAVTLHCSLDLNCKRLDTDARDARYSLTDPKVLCKLREAHDLLKPTSTTRLDLDTSNTTPHENALRVVEAAQRLLAGAA
jgi:uncharacterized membrane protein